MFFETDYPDRYKSARKYLLEHPTQGKDLYFKDDAGDGDSFAVVLEAFKNYKPIRNMEWAPGVYAVLNKDNKTMTMYYEDKESEKLDHENEMECIGINDLINDKWRVVYQCRKDF